MGRGPGVRAVGKEAIQIDFRWKGVRCRERLRLRPTAANLKYVARLKATIEHEIATGTFDYARHFPDSGRARVWNSGVASLAAALQAYVVSLTGSVELETARDYSRDAEIIAGWFPKKTLRTLTRADLRLEISKHPLSKQRLDNLLRPLRGAFEQAVEDDPTHPNPLKGFKIRRVETPKEEDGIDPFTPDELAKLRRTECGELWIFWAWSGLRSGEIIGLRRGDVDLASGHVAVRRAIRLGREKLPKTKAGSRLVHLLPAARAVLRVHDRSEAALPLFTNPRTGKDWHEAKALNREFVRACRAANIRYRYVYQLRHTFATWALSSGENPLWVARMMGHKDVNVLYRHYAKWMPSLDPKAGAKMAKAARGQHAA